MSRINKWKNPPSERPTKSCLPKWWKLLAFYGDPYPTVGEGLRKKPTVVAKKNNKVVVSQIFFIFTPNPGEMIQFDDHIFQMGWFNHQLEKNDFSKGWIVEAEKNMGKHSLPEEIPNTYHPIYRCRWWKVWDYWNCFITFGTGEVGGLQSPKVAFMVIVFPKDPITFSDDDWVYNHLLSKVFRLHYHSQKVIGSPGFFHVLKFSLEKNNHHPRNQSPDVGVKFPRKSPPDTKLGKWWKNLSAAGWGRASAPDNLSGT